MDIKYTKHIYDKLKRKEIIELKITLETIEKAIKNPIAVDKSI